MLLRPSSANQCFIEVQRYPHREVSKTLYNYFRTYDPSIGRYTQSDPIGLAGDAHRYLYVNANPVVRVDPTGEFAIAGAIVGAIAGGVGGAITGGDATSVLIGGLVGAAVGFINPAASAKAGSSAAVGAAAAQAAVASVAGQVLGNLVNGRRSLSGKSAFWCNLNPMAAIMAGWGGAVGALGKLPARVGGMFTGRFASQAAEGIVDGVIAGGAESFGAWAGRDASLTATCGCD